MNVIDVCGLVLNFIGTLLIVFYIRTDSKEYVENEEGQKPGERWYVLLIKHPRWLSTGIVLIAIGFALNIIAEILK